MTTYAARADLYKYGLPRGVLGMGGRIVDTALASTDVVSLDGHGFETNDPILFRAAEGGTLSAPLVAGTTYYAITLSQGTFQIASAPNGSAINLTTDGVSMFVAAPLPFDDVLEFYSRWADSFLPAHAVPLATPIPVLVKGVVAELSAKKLMQLAGHKADSIDQAELAAKAMLERWAAGVPLRGDTAEASANKSIATSIVTSGSDPRGWGSRSLP